MKKILLLFSIAFISLTVYSQRWLVTTFHDVNYQYKKHYTHSIEDGVENGRFMQYVAGNKTDWGVYNNTVSGHKFNENVVLSCVDVMVAGGHDNLHLTDFEIHPTNDPKFGVGTGVYYPDGATGNGYPFFGIYEKESGQIISAVYYLISHPNPGPVEPMHSTGLRIKYSERDNSYFIAGVMIDRRFSDLDFNNLNVKSRGFILKVDYKGLNPRYLEFIPDNLPNIKDPLLCAITDIEIRPDGNQVAFTGFNTEDNFTNYYHPMAGVIDLNMNIQWCHVFEHRGERFSGIDIEYTDLDERLLILSNSTKNVFAVMEVDHNGIPVQPILRQVFNDPVSGREGAARAHIMHCIGKEVYITGNFFSGNDQLLFNYMINDAHNFGSADNFYKSYSRELIPPGQQEAVTAYWAPENSVYQNENLFLVGVYSNVAIDPPKYGFTFVNKNGIDPECVETGEVIHTMMLPEIIEREARIEECEWHHFPTEVLSCKPEALEECVAKHKSSVEQELFDGSIRWEFRESNENGIRAILYSEELETFNINVYDVLGRNVYSSDVRVDYGQKEVYLNFNMKPEVYIVKISNGTIEETVKIMGK